MAEEKNIDKIGYNEAISELESIVQKMQSPDCDIDKLSQYTARALQLLKHCKLRLTKTDEEIKRCLEELA